MAAAISADVAMVLASVVPGVLCCLSRGAPTMAVERLSSTAELLRPGKSDGSMSWPSTWGCLSEDWRTLCLGQNAGGSSRATAEDDEERTNRGMPKWACWAFISYSLMRRSNSGRANC